MISQELPASHISAIVCGSTPWKPQSSESIELAMLMSTSLQDLHAAPPAPAVPPAPPVGAPPVAPLPLPPVLAVVVVVRVVVGLVVDVSSSLQPDATANAPTDTMAAIFKSI